MDSEQPALAPGRLESIDILRGMVMALMVVDHMRDFVAPTAFVPTDLDSTTAGFFLTRWVTHFCAPSFVFLAGVGVGLWAHQVRDSSRVRRFLVSRGLWLVAIELCVVNPLWMWSIWSSVGHVVALQVIWAIGVSMLFLAGVLFLGKRCVGLLSLLIIVGHHGLDSIGAGGSLGSHSWRDVSWMLLHEPGGFLLPLPGAQLYAQVVYPLLPWIGVLALGWSLSGIFALAPRERDALCRRLGWGLLLGFVALRAGNLYGDPSPWASQERGALYSFFSFINVSKYPVSLLYLMLTLGTAFLVLPKLQDLKGALAGCFLVLGRVPLFFYVLHLAAITLIGAAFCEWNDLPLGFWAQRVGRFEHYRPNLVLVWSLSAALLLCLYAPCAWFARLKRRRSAWWLRYL